MANDKFAVAKWTRVLRIRADKCCSALLLVVLVTLLFVIHAVCLTAETMPVRHKGGLLHGFLVLRTLDGTLIADGDLTQIAQGDKITTRLIFKFKDGSLNDETTVYSQRGTFRVLSDHLIQKGPAFKRSTDTMLNAANGQVTVRYADDDGKEKVITEKITLPPDLANGIIPTILENFEGGAPPARLSMLATTPKPRLVKLAITPEGEDSFSVGISKYKAAKYAVKIELGGAAGVVAPLVGKAPPDLHFWVLAGSAPVFVKSEGPLFEGGPIWRIEIASPVWSQNSAGIAPKEQSSRSN